MPLAKEPGSVALAAEHLGDRVFADSHSAGVGGEDSVAKRVASRQAGSSRRRAQRCRGVKSIEGNAAGCHFVEVRRDDFFVAIEANVSPALIVAHQHDDVGLRFVVGLGNER